jgi:phospho-2-dehydro-3-deoxyheptonate aldolase
LLLARDLLEEIAGFGLPIGCEFLDPIVPSYLADLVAWGRGRGAQVSPVPPHLSTQRFDAGVR